MSVSYPAAIAATAIDEANRVQLLGGSQKDAETMLSSADIDALVNVLHAQYAACDFAPSNDYQYTVLAAFVLVSDSYDDQSDERRDRDSAVQHASTANFASESIARPRKKLKVISLATGAKCLPSSRLPLSGDALHDSHAEVLARRGAVRWLFEEVRRAAQSPNGSQWLINDAREDGTWRMREHISLVMYVSTVPCGDASTRLLASQQDPIMAALKDFPSQPGSPASPAVTPPLPPFGTARGRDGYAYRGVLRTKPGRADSPPTLCLSCSDKIAAWAVLGMQGALAARLFARSPVYVSGIILGDVPTTLRGDVLDDCKRAFYQRLEGIKNLPTGYGPTNPTIYFTDLAFVHSRTSLQASRPTDPPPTSCNESLCWYADSFEKSEVIINGARRGVGSKQRGLEKFQPKLCKLQLFRLYAETLKSLNLDIPCDLETSTYHTVKRRSCNAYQRARAALKGERVHDGGSCSIPAVPAASASESKLEAESSGSSDSRHSTDIDMRVAINPYVAPATANNAPPTPQLNLPIPCPNFVADANPIDTMHPSSPPNSPLLKTPAPGCSTSTSTVLDSRSSRNSNSNKASTTFQSGTAAAAPFGGWLISGAPWESFDIEGKVISTSS